MIEEEIPTPNAIRDWIIFAIETATALTSLYFAIRIIVGDSGVKAMRMQLAKTGEDTFQGIAVKAAHCADYCHKLYEASRDVTV